MKRYSKKFKEQKGMEFIEEFCGEGFIMHGHWETDAGSYLPDPPIQHVKRGPAATEEQRKASKIAQLQHDLAQVGLVWKKGAKERAQKLLEELLAE